ncbi:MAG: metallophosphoesterase [Flavobacteriales bacterium]|nr:metallophosphoesterase [Flavobacteriales bacterium]
MIHQKEERKTVELSSKYWQVSRFSVVLFLLIANVLQAQNVKHSIYLIGDAGKDTLPGPALLMLEEELKEHQNSSVIFLGDNIYPAGLEGKEGNKKKHLSEMKLLSQLERTRDFTGHVFWVPGNHDWKAGRWQGHWLVQKEAEFVESYYAQTKTIKNDSGHVFMPKDGLPGPLIEKVEEGGFDLIAIDVQWWLQDQFFHKVPTEYGLNKRRMEKRFLERLDTLIATSVSEGKLTMIAAHHPMFSNGHHGAAKQPFRFIFNWVPPFQLFGLIGLNRALVQDIPQPRYKRIRNKILNVLNKYEGLVYVSGHDHNLQYLKKENNHYLISGAGSKRSSLSGDKYGATYMDDQNYGFMRLDVMEDGKINCHVFGHTKGGIIHSFWLN